MRNTVRELRRRARSAVSFQEAQQRRNRRRFDESLLRCIRPLHTGFQGTLLVDAMWDNPNYWLRYAILRAAIGVAPGQEVGLLGHSRRHLQLGTLKRLGIGRTVDFVAHGNGKRPNQREAADRVAALVEAADILSWELPEEVPAMLLYDFILKKQRLATVDVKHPHIGLHVEMFLDGIYAAKRIVDELQPDVIVASHALGLYALVVWMGLRRSAQKAGDSEMSGRVVVPFGYAGTCRFWQVRDCGRIFDFMDHPAPSDARSLSPQKRRQLRDVGRLHLRQRLLGQTDNLGAIQAYNSRHQQIDRETICRQFGWDPANRIVGVYAPNWFDYPHTFGMARFRDFKDWMETTLDAACRNERVNWLFKAHPCDDWYGGITLEDLVDDRNVPAHVRLADKSWNGAALLHAIDAVVTCHGTVGIEMTSLGKPALTAEQGLYHDWGFARFPSGRSDYVNRLTSEWWAGMDAEANRELAELFAGWWWGKPAWQEALHIEDDARQWEIYKSAPPLLEQNAHVVDKEVQTTRDWLDSGEPYYHVYKMARADDYIP